MRKVEIKDVPVGCDFCVVGPMEWTYRCKPGTTVMAFQDTRTGKVSVTKSSGYVCACSECKKLIQGVLAPRRLTHRVLGAGHPTYKSMSAEHLKVVRQNLIKIYSKFLPKLHSPRPYCPNEDPLEGRLLTLGGSDHGVGNVGI